MYAFGVLMGELLTGKQLNSSTCAQASSQLPKHQRLALQVLLSTDPESACPTAGQLLASPLFTDLPEMRDCCITFEHALLDNGVECANPVTGSRHFMTKEAFAHHVQAESSKDLDQIKKSEGNVFCPLRGHGCESAAFSDFQVSAVLFRCQTGKY